MEPIRPPVIINGTVNTPEKAPRAPRAKRIEVVPTTPVQPEKTGRISPERLENANARRQNALGRVSGAFSGIKEKLATGTNYAIAGGDILFEKTQKFATRMEDGILGAAERCDSFCKNKKEGLLGRVHATSDKAARWGLGIAANVEDKAVGGLSRVQEFVHGQRAKWEGFKAERAAAKTAVLEAKKARIQNQIDTLRPSLEGATDKMWNSLISEKETAEKRKNYIGVMRGALLGLEKKPANA